MILQDMKIEAFRGITNVSLDKLSPVSIVFGANNAGKSSILEAASLILRPFLLDGGREGMVVWAVE